MVVAAFGYITPVAGALLQEGIDIAVILNALRALKVRDLVPRRRHVRSIRPRKSCKSRRRDRPRLATEDVMALTAW